MSDRIGYLIQAGLAELDQRQERLDMAELAELGIGVSTQP